MLVTITYNDTESFTEEEAVKNNASAFGKAVEVTVSPTSNNPESLIYFALQNMLSVEQLDLYHDRTRNYEKGEKEIRDRAHAVVSAIMSRVLEDNIKKCQ